MNVHMQNPRHNFTFKIQTLTFISRIFLRLFFHYFLHSFRVKEEERRKAKDDRFKIFLVSFR